MSHPKSPKEEREGFFSSLSLTFFSPSVPQSTINLFTSNGGLALPTLDAMELQHYFRSPLTEYHPFYHVDLIFVTGPNDLLGTVLRERVLIYYDYRWVGKCVERGELFDMGRYIVDFPIKSEVEGGKEGDEINVDGDQVNRQPINNTFDRPTSQLNHESLTDRLTSTTSLPITDNLLKYAVRTVPPSAFTSESALRKASFNPTPGSRFRASTAPFARPRSFTPLNAVAGPSKVKDYPIQELVEQIFMPFESSSQRTTSERSVTPQLRIPYKALDQDKSRQFERRMKACKVHDLVESYPDMMKCGKGDQMIMGLGGGLSE